MERLDVSFSPPAQFFRKLTARRILQFNIRFEFYAVYITGKNLRKQCIEAM